MSMKKRNKVDHIEPNDTCVPETLKSYQNGTANHNQIARKATWQNPENNIQRITTSAKNTQDCQSSASSKKRNSFDEEENKSVESTSKTASNEANPVRNKLKAYRRSRKNKSSNFIDGSMNCTMSESGSESIKNSYDVNLDKKVISKNTRETTEVSKEKEKSVSTFPKGTKARSYLRTGPKQKISAQLRLISKRKEFEAITKRALKSLEARNSKNFLMEIEKEETVTGVHSSERKNTNCKSRVPVMPRVRERVKRHLEECTEKYVNLKHDNLVSYESSTFLDEEMDWEPSEQEVMIEHIKKMRRDCGNTEELSNDIELCSNTIMETTQDDSDLFLVFDTNVFISCLPFIKDIRDTCIPVLGFPRIFIPWRVLQELDHLKTSDIKPLQVSAVRAIRFLNENFSSRHPRVTGQSFEEHNSTEERVRSCPDDEILRVCLHLKQKDRSKIVILITNDKNLESKAIVSGIKTFSKNRFMKEKLGDSNRKSYSANTPAKKSNIPLKSDMAYCRLKGALKKFLEMLLETEFMNAFNNDWKKIVMKKPPWMLMDMFDCLIKYWRSVFHFIFKRDVLVLIEDLKDHFLKVDKGEILVVKDIAQVSKDLLTRMMVFVTDEKPYSKILTDTLAEIEMWVESKNLPNVATEYQTTLPSPVPSSSQEPVTTRIPQFDTALCKEKVKNLFQIIWEQVKAFCFRVSELAASNGINNPDAVNEVKIQFPHVIRNIQELVEIVEKLLSLGPTDASQADQLILHFTSFLVGLNVFQIDATELSNLPAYIRLFFGDNDGRIVLCTLVNDLKQFANGMMDGMKVLERL